MGRTVRGIIPLSYCVELSPINKLNVSKEHVSVLGLPMKIMVSPGLESDSSTAWTLLNQGQLYCEATNK